MYVYTNMSGFWLIRFLNLKSSEISSGELNNAWIKSYLSLWVLGRLLIKTSKGNSFLHYMWTLLLDIAAPFAEYE